MELSRRGFLKLSGATLAALASGLGFDLKVAQAQGFALRIDGTTKIPSICHFCSGGCGLLLHIKDDKLVYLDGDPDNPVNSGALCPKGASLGHVANAQDRLFSPKYRAPGATEWQDISWDEAINKIAAKIKEVRDNTWVDSEEINGQTYKVNRCDGIAVIGSAEVDNEESYIIKKFSEIIGSPYNEHQARI